MPLTQNIVKQKWFIALKILIILLMGVALTAEILPEVQAKLIVVPALILAMTLGLIEILKR